MLNAESTLLTARQQMAALVADAAIQRVTLLLSVGGGFNPPVCRFPNDQLPRTDAMSDRQHQ